MQISTRLQGELIHSRLPMPMAQSGLERMTALPNPLMAIGEQRKSGLILCKHYHAEFAGPGAVVGSPVEENYRAVVSIGSPNMVLLETHEERQRAYSRRIQWGRWLQRIVDNPDPIQRAEWLFTSFEEFFNYQVAANLPDPILALMIGVFPQTIQSVRSQYQKSGRLPSSSSDITKRGVITIKCYDSTFIQDLMWEGTLVTTEGALQFPFSA